MTSGPDARMRLEKNVSPGSPGVLVAPVECCRYARKHTCKRHTIIIPYFPPLSLFPWTPAAVFSGGGGKENVQNKNRADLIRPSGCAAEAAVEIHSAAVQ